MICIRCGKDYEYTVPEATHPGDNTEIASAEYCAGCNAFIMNIVFRESSAYRTKHPHDPYRGGTKDGNS